MTDRNVIGEPGAKMCAACESLDESDQEPCPCACHLSGVNPRPTADYGASCGGCGHDFAFSTQQDRSDWLGRHNPEHGDFVSFFRLTTDRSLT